MDFTGMAQYDGTLTQGENGLVYAGDEDVHYAADNGVYPLAEDGFIPEAFATDTEFVESHTLLADGGQHYGVAALTFDIEEELLWMGNQGGHVTSYYGVDMQKYTSFQVHANEEVRQILTTPVGILALTSSSLRGQIRRGIPLFTHSSENMVEMQCMLQTSPTSLLMGGHQNKLIELDLTEGVEINHVDVGDDGCAILRPHSRFICAGDPSGRICLRDPNTLSLEHTLETHSASLSDFDVHGNLLVTCGFSNSRSGALTVDRFLMVYDLRMLRAVSPIPVVLDPLLLRFMPSLSSRLAVVSVTGQLQLADTVSLSTPNLSLYQVNMGGSMCLSLDVSSSCQSLAIGDNGGVIHLFTQSTAVFNSYSRPTEFADTPDPVEPFSIEDESAIYASIPLQLPAAGTKLLSDWPEECLKKVYRPTPPIDPEILRTMKMQGTIGYAPNPLTRRRNQVLYKLDGSGRAGRNALNGHNSGDSRGKSDEAGFIAIPWRYRKVDIKYSRLGAEDFDFEQYNSTPFSGLEASLPNSYSNAMLQVLYFIEPLRKMMLSHLCQREFCLACELGFLFHMLDSAKGFPCQAANFQRAFRTVPEAYALGLLLSDQNPEKKTNLIRLIQSWNRFILHQIQYEFLENQKQQQQIEDQSQFVYNENDFPAIVHRDSIPPIVAQGIQKSPEETESSSRNDDTLISRLLGFKQSLTHRCYKCGHQVVKESDVLLCNLVYPNIADKSESSEYDFTSVLAQSLCPKKTTPAWCDQCEKFQPTEQSKGLQQLPHILSVNCGMDTEQDVAFWKAQIETIVKRPTDNSTSVQSPGRPCRYGSSCSRPNCRFRHPTVAAAEKPSEPSVPSQKQHSKVWLPHSIRLQRLTSGVIRGSSVDSEAEDGEDVAETFVYDLSAVICHVNDERKNVVSLINVGPSYFERAGRKPRSNWYLFNDFSVTSVPQQEAVWFSLDWKIPCVLYWTHRNIPEDLVPPASNPITLDVFGEDNSLARNNGARKMITFSPLLPDEMPAPGELVAMDAEFVTLNQEEAEVRSDGKVSTVKPSHKSVARITCIRGQGPMEGTPFIDDYISTQEQVVDYLTKFSGIEPGDLDANFSSKHLTTLKSTYQKLRFLIDIGVKFVGHGLKNDFRVINLVVPPEQIADTVSLFHLPNHRYVSLRFLSWHFLGVNIQSRNHDSIEDARAALQLYRHYQQLEAEGKIKDALHELYQTGNALQWTVPGEDVD